MHSPIELFLYPFTGLYKECYEIDYVGLSDASPMIADGPYCLSNLNNLWWYEALSIKSLHTIVERLRARYSVTDPEGVQYKAILRDPDKFICAVQDAPRTLANLGAGARKTFSALETLQIFCNAYSDMVSFPFALSLQEGLVMNELSSVIIAREAMNPATNPYLPFILKHVAPVLETAKPDLLWLVGRIKTSTFAMARLAKEINPNCHISVIGHSSEYYSLNKITRYLQRNDVLFSTIDSIILDDFENTMPQLRECLASGQDLETVPNLLFATRENGEITNSREAGTGSGLPKSNVEIVNTNLTPIVVSHRTHENATSYHPVSVQKNQRSHNHVDPSQVVSTKLWPNAKCYWDQCNFCAINRKYKTLPRNAFKDAHAVADYMEVLAHQKDITYIWSYDEAIPPSILGELAEILIDREISIQWETRSKIDKNFTPEVCRLLGQAGLREIRLGLESASPQVLSNMGKFPDSWSLKLIEQIVSNFHQAGVSVHFPTIIGFPTETEENRLETFSFLRYIVTKYPSVTFNMNILGLDVASKLFRDYELYGITNINWPTHAKYFLGNLLDWDCQDNPFNYESLDYQRNELMRKLLYSWMPSSSILPVYIFYRLAETSRATMVWKAQRSNSGNWKDELPPLEDTMHLVLSDLVVISSPIDKGPFVEGNRYLLYDWETHHSMECNDEGLQVLEVLSKPVVFQDLTSEMQKAFPQHSSEYIMGQLVAQVQKLYSMGIVKCYDAREEEMGKSNELIEAN